MRCKQPETQRKTVAVRVETANLIDAVATAVEQIVPWERKLERSSTRRRISSAEMTENAVRLGLQRICEDNGIDYPG